MDALDIEHWTGIERNAVLSGLAYHELNGMRPVQDCLTDKLAVRTSLDLGQ